ncbi:LOW QUALITY PROTEIN: hypothetical protein V2J09_006705 [Rumex salicifolius]
MKGSSGLASVGGVIRDVQGQLICGFNAWSVYGCRSGTFGELSLAYNGLGYRKIHVETDSTEAKKLLEKGIEPHHLLHSLVVRGQGSIQRVLLVQITHTSTKWLSILSKLGSMVLLGIIVCMNHLLILGIVC